MIDRKLIGPTPNMREKLQIDHVLINGNGDVRCKMCVQEGAQIFTSMVKQELQGFKNAISKIHATGER